jgi:phenylacetate-CoA ligase
MDEIVINRVKGKDYSEETDPGLVAAMREVFDESVRLTIHDVPAIPQEASGKYRFSFCKV